MMLVWDYANHCHGRLTNIYSAVEKYRPKLFKNHEFEKYSKAMDDITQDVNITRIVYIQGVTIINLLYDFQIYGSLGTERLSRTKKLMSHFTSVKEEETVIKLLCPLKTWEPRFINENLIELAKGIVYKTLENKSIFGDALMDAGFDDPLIIENCHLLTERCWLITKLTNRYLETKE